VKKYRIQSRWTGDVQIYRRPSGGTPYRTLKGEDFLWRVLQHVLPKGFRRVRDYGFLHGNAKKLLSAVQLVLKVVIKVVTPRLRPVFTCPKCQSPLHSALLEGNFLELIYFIFQRVKTSFPRLS
jgi:hypothetical protein